jgi:PAS domain S-box-containing protein
MGRNGFELIPPPQRARRREVFQRVLAGEHVGPQAWSILRPDGEIREGVVHIVRVTSPEGLHSLLGCFLDMTERKKLDRELHARRSFYEGLASSEVGLICRFDPNHRTTYINQALCDLIGQEPEQLLGKTPFEVTHPQDVPLAWDALGRAVATRSAVHGEFRVTSPHGWRHIECILIPVFAESGELLEIQSVGHDVSEKRDAQQRSERERQLLRAVLDNNPYAIAVMDREGKSILANQALADLIGSPLPNGSDMMAMARRSGQGLPEKAEAALAGQRQQLREYWFNLNEIDPGAPDRRVCVDSVMVPLTDSAGEVHSVVVMLRDITAQMRAKEELGRVQRSLMAAREQERRSLAGELHDSVGQQLVAAQLALKSAREQLDDDAARQVDKAVRSLGELIQEIRRISYGLYPPTLESLGLWASLKQLCQFAQHAGIRTETRAGGGMEHRRLEPTVEIALFRIAQEAIHNVSRHSGASALQLRLTARNGSVLLSVKDDGQGFDPADATRRGLGLNTMQDRAEAVGGTLRIDSNSGGTEVRVEIPADVEGD